MTPDECIFRGHLEEVPFVSGVDRQKWDVVGGIQTLRWPCPVIWVQAAPRLMSDGRIFLKFDLTNYPQIAPTSCPWDIPIDNKLPFASWPKGPGNVSAVFNPGWNGGNALYAPCDRLAMPGHEPWQNQLPQWWWRSDFTIVKYLDFVYQCLNSGYESA